MTMHWVLSLPCFKKNKKSFSYTLLRLVLFAIYILYLLYFYSMVVPRRRMQCKKMYEYQAMYSHLFRLLSIFMSPFSFLCLPLFFTVFFYSASCVARNKSLESRIYNLDAIFLRFVSLYAFHRWNDAIQLKRYNNLVGMCVKVQM